MYYSLTQEANILRCLTNVFHGKAVNTELISVISNRGKSFKEPLGWSNNDLSFVMRLEEDLKPHFAPSSTKNTGYYISRP